MLAPLRTLAKDLLQHTVLRGAFLWRLPADSRAAALTFDDGPHPEFTPAVLDLLAVHGLKASFFMIGELAARYPKLAERVAAEGHSIGGHTYGHHVIVRLDVHRLREELSTCRAAIADACGVDTVLFRPPKGRVDLPSMRRVAQLGYRLVHWSRTYSDYRRDSAAALAERMVRDPIQLRDIVLLHDDNPYTPQALRRALPGWRSNGIEFTCL